MFSKGIFTLDQGQPVGVGNFHIGRQALISAIVIHVMDGTLKGTSALFSQRPDQRNGAQHSHASSAHYGISQSGFIVHWVSEEDTAYHAGNVQEPTWVRIKDEWSKSSHRFSGLNPNAYTIGIEHEGTGSEELAKRLYLSYAWPDAMVEASAALIAQICRKHMIPMTREFIVGHNEIFSGKTCPGPAPMDRLVQRAKEIDRAWYDKTSLTD